jgi:RHS repeat-associated protein
VGTANTEYLYDLNGNVISELNPSTWLNVYLRLNGGLFAQYTVGGPRTQFVHVDHLGSTRLLTTMSQSVADSLDYLPFGEQIAGGTGTTHKFTGKERDSESNLDNFAARYDSWSVGRFMSPDPENAGANSTNPQSWNMYSYVLNNPLIFTDPTGEECVWDDGSFDAQDDAKTGSVTSCQAAGGTWIELGQNGGWSGQANPSLQKLVTQIQSGQIASVMVSGTDGAPYVTDYSSGQVTQTITPSGPTLFGYSKTGSTPSYAGVGLAAAGCIAAEPCGGGEVAFGALFLVVTAVVDTSRQFARWGTQNIVPSWAEGERPLPGESATDFAKRLCDARYGAGKYPTGPGSEFSKIKKWARDKFGI